MKRVSYSEYLGWVAYFRQKDNEPSPSDYYLMQLAYYMDQTRKPDPTLKKYQLVSKTKKRKLSQEEKKAITENAIQTRLQAIGYKSENR